MAKITRFSMLPEPPHPETASVPPPRASRLGPLSALLGLLLFVYFVRRAGPAEIVAALGQVAWGFPILILLSGGRQLARSVGWMYAIEGHRLPLRAALPAVITGDALGNLTPLGLLVGEPAKCLLVRDRVPPIAALSGLAIENFFYSLSAAVTIALGAVVLLAIFPLSFGLKMVSAGLLAGMTLLLVAAWWIVRKELALGSGGLGAIASFGVGRARLEGWRKVAGEMEGRIYGFYRRNPGAVATIVIVEVLYHVFGTAEIYATLWLLGEAGPRILDCFVLESTNRAVNVIFRFVPLRIGIDEAGTALFANVLRLGTTIGVALAVVRKARVLFWTATGVLILVRRGLSMRALAAEATWRS
jgi:hypothetical protein